MAFKYFPFWYAAEYYKEAVWPSFNLSRKPIFSIQFGSFPPVVVICSMFVLGHAGVEEEYYDSRRAVVCSLAQILNDLFEELKVVLDAWSIFQETMPTA